MASAEIIDINASPKRSSSTGAMYEARDFHEDELEHNPDVIGPLWFGSVGSSGVAQEMWRNAHCSLPLKIRGATLRAGTWDFEPPRHDKSELAAEVAAFCSHVFIESLDFGDAINKFCRSGRDGFSLVEMTTDHKDMPRGAFPSLPGNGSAIVPTGYHHIPAWSIHAFSADAKNPSMVKSVQQFAGYRGLVDLPIKNIMRLTLDQEGGDFAGVAHLRAAYSPYKALRTLYVLRMIRMERFGVGTPTITYPDRDGEPPTASERAEAIRILKDVKSSSAGYLFLPGGWKFEWSVTTDTGIGDAIEKSMADCVREIYDAFGMGWLRLGAGGGNGSYALAGTQEGAGSLLIDDDSDRICSVFNHGSDGWSPVRRIVAQNYGPGAPVPSMVCRNLPTKPYGDILKTINATTQAGNMVGGPAMNRFAHEVMGVPMEIAAPASKEATTDDQ